MICVCEAVTVSDCVKFEVHVQRYRDPSAEANIGRFKSHSMPGSTALRVCAALPPVPVKHSPQCLCSTDPRACAALPHVHVQHCPPCLCITVLTVEEAPVLRQAGDAKLRQPLVDLFTDLREDTGRGLLRWW